MKINSVNENVNYLDSQSSVSDYIAVLKPRVMALAIFTSLCGLIISPDEIHPFLFVLSIFCISLGAGASGAINMWFDRDIDKLMDRTKKRPIPNGKISPADALGFGIILSLISIIVLGLSVNYFAAFLLGFSIFFYVFIYTIWLKRRTPQNIVIGGAAGAFPPVIGWTISMGSLSLEPLTFFLIIFFWTPSHFWALSLYKSDDYKKAKLPMLPLTNGVESTKLNIFIYSLLMVPVIIFPFLIDFVGFAFLIPSLMLTFYYNYLCYQLFNFKKDRFNPKIAKTIFGYSILYLFLIFVLFLIDKIV